MAAVARFPMMWLIWSTMLLLSSALHGCDSPVAPITGPTANVVIAGKTFVLDIAADNPTRMKGLGGRTSIAEDGGMIFAFPKTMVRRMGFVMRDCPIDIDIIYLDGAGKVLTTYAMKHEAPRAPDEGVAGDSDYSTVTDEARRKGDEKYDGRLKQYDSRYVCSFAIELKDGTIEKLGVKEGDRILFDIEGLKQRAK